MLSMEQLWTELDRIARERGLALFDIERVAGSGGSLQVYLCAQDGHGRGVTLDQCASVAAQINELPNLEEILPGDAIIEVSSPGINRVLRRPEHFAGAIGERIRIVADIEGRKERTVCGELVAFDGKQLEIVERIRKRKAKQNVEEPQKLVVALSKIDRAQVDFDFRTALASSVHK